jgi:mono/diheme cytochrome c family protein
MKLRYVVFTLALAVALAGCDLLLQRSEGEKLWRGHCAKCHGINAAGNTPGYMSELYADLTDDVWHAGDNDGAMQAVIERGVFGKMPGFPQLTPQQVRALVDHIRVLRGEKTRGTSS